MTLKINRTKVMRPDDPDAVWTQIPEHGEDVEILIRPLSAGDIEDYQRKGPEQAVVDFVIGVRGVEITERDGRALPIRTGRDLVAAVRSSDADSTRALEPFFAAVDRLARARYYAARAKLEAEPEKPAEEYATAPPEELARVAAMDPLERAALAMGGAEPEKPKPRGGRRR